MKKKGKEEKKKEKKKGGDKCSQEKLNLKGFFSLLSSLLSFFPKKKKG